MTVLAIEVHLGLLNRHMASLFWHQIHYKYAMLYNATLYIKYKICINYIIDSVSESSGGNENGGSQKVY